MKQCECDGSSVAMNCGKWHAMREICFVEMNVMRILFDPANSFLLFDPSSVLFRKP